MHVHTVTTYKYVTVGGYKYCTRLLKLVC